MRRHLFAPELDEFRAVVRAFVETEVEPDYSSWVDAGRPPGWFWRRAGEIGILGIGVPKEYGGLDASTFVHSVVVTEEIQRRFLALGGVRVHTDICMPYLLEYATDEQKDRWLPRLASGGAVVALGLSEPGAGSDLKAMSTRAVRDGDHYVVDGAKTFISNGAAADLVILAVKTDPSAGRRGISLLVVESDTPGFERGRKLAKLGLQAQDLAELSFTGMRVPAENLLGAENRGFEYLTANLAQERLSIAVNSQAAARAALGAAVERTAGGEVGQSAKFALATAAVDVDAGQALIDQAVRDLVDGELGPSDAAAVKLYATELQSRTVGICLDVVGPTAFRAADPLGQAYLDGRVSRVYGGSSEIMKVIVAKSLGL
ncbi:acyl-CoA dehydrogenase family protein [Actinomycetospora sp. TBRC 11914]|uniref:acyl-CoA dehydrogenase family protein n=1 Tax=Actinomycetospora sp. TBRC 11914 TaxID=2729387 RepID=UPI00145E1A0E|nr:acyl-CoA dehydrogenase family protein [Actinomycetospora sp. TBRC 11914]NMO91642.1 acyl-CoA dehydrogenase [Actinomycetospora sp. TBRC 11914]